MAEEVLNPLGDHLSLSELELLAKGGDPGQEARDHVAQCEICRQEVEVLRALFSVDPSPSEVDGAKVWKGIRHRRQRRLQFASGAVAALVLLSFLWIPGLLPTGPDLLSAEHQHKALSLKWLESEQLENGSWRVEDWGGKSRFTLGVTSMAILAMLDNPSLASAESIQRGLNFLIGKQNEDGSFGEQFLGDLYNHSLATLAIREADRLGYSLPAGTLARAQGFLNVQRHVEGGWGYRPTMEMEENLSAWAAKAMNEALALKGHEVGASVAESSHTFAELQERRRGKRSPMDIYLGDETASSQEWENWKSALLSEQVQDGELAGTWPVDSQWGRVGGRVFSTGIALLALR